MNEKISLTIDVSKISKSKIIERKYKDKDGNEVTAKEYNIDIVPLKEVKVLKSGNGWDMVKTHFAAEAQSKEERAAKAKTVYVGEGITFKKEFQQPSAVPAGIDYPTEEISVDSIPF